MDRDHVVDRRVRGDDARAGAHDRAALRSHHDVVAVFLDAHDGRVGMKPAAVAADAARQPLKILERMKAALVREAQAAPSVPAGDRRPLGPGDAHEPDLSGGLELPVEHGGFGAGAEEKIAVQALEAAIDALLARDLLDAVDSGGLGLVHLPRLVEAAQFDQLVVVVVEFGGEVGGGARRHASADRTAVEHDHGSPGAGEFVSDRQAGDAGSDHDHIGRYIGRESRRVLNVRALAPYRCAALEAGVHGGSSWRSFTPAISQHNRNRALGEAGVLTANGPGGVDGEGLGRGSRSAGIGV